MSPSLSADLGNLLKENGASLVGYADLSPVGEDERGAMPVGVAMAMALTPSIVAGITDGPTEEYAREYDRVNGLLGGLAELGAAFLRKSGFRAEGRPATQHNLPADLITPLPQKTLATLAGLGWIGKCALLVTPEYGTAVRLGSILTDAPLRVGTPITESKCGNCRVCADICPGHAPTGRDWKRGMPRKEFFDAFACQDACVRIGRERGISHLICGKCVALCPYTRKWLEQERGRASGGGHR